jgi:hypothetical protein
VLRAGWGRFYQSQGIHELNVQDGDDTFYPAELAEHRVVGLEYVFHNDVNIRLEAYHKKLSDIRPRYQNLDNEVEFFPEVQGDRVRLEPERGEAKGLEFFLKRDTGDRLSWWFSYGLAFAEDQIGGRTVPRRFDQRHTIYIDLNYRPSRKWRINLAWQYHTGLAVHRHGLCSHRPAGWRRQLYGAVWSGQCGAVLCLSPTGSPRPPILWVCRQSIVAFRGSAKPIQSR